MSDRDRALSRLGLAAVRVVPHLDLLRVHPLRLQPTRAAVLSQPAVASVQGLGSFRATATPTTVSAAPNDPGFSRQWNLPMIQVPEAWSISRGAGATVAVLDTGVAYEDHGIYKQAPDLAGTRFVAGHDFVDGSDHPNDDIDPSAPERAAHGTHSASVIAETTNNAIGEAGVAPDAAIMPVRVLNRDGSGTDDQIAAGIVFAADHGAQVINMSFDSPEDRPMTRAAVSYAAAKGVTMVAAVGNSGRPPVGYPAAYRQVIAVGAVRIDKSRAAYSSYGDLGDVDLVAPGGDLSVDQNGDGVPDGILAQSMVYATNQFGELQVEGTSAAAPHVSAVAALLIGSGLATTAAQVRKALEVSALDLGPPGPDTYFGHGLVQARAALTAAGAPPAGPTSLTPTPTQNPPAAVIDGTRGRRRSLPRPPPWLDEGLLGLATAIGLAAMVVIVAARRRRSR